MTTTELIRQWSVDRGLDTADKNKQFVKLIEEIGELADGMSKNNFPKIVDSIGDAYVVLTILAQQHGILIEDCIDSAYNEIKDRKGKLINGVFVKESDLKGD